MRKIRVVSPFVVVALVGLLAGTSPSASAGDNDNVEVAGSGRVINLRGSGRTIRSSGARNARRYAGWQYFTVRVYDTNAAGEFCYFDKRQMFPPGVTPIDPPAPPVLPIRCVDGPAVERALSRSQLIVGLTEAFGQLELPIPRPVTAAPGFAITGLPVAVTIGSSSEFHDTIDVGATPVRLDLTSTFQVSFGDGTPLVVASPTPTTTNFTAVARHTYLTTGPLARPAAGAVDIVVSQRWGGTWSAPSLGMSGVFTDDLVAINDIDLMAFPVRQLEAVRHVRP